MRVRTRWVTSPGMVSCLLADCDLVISWGRSGLGGLTIPEGFVFHLFVQFMYFFKSYTHRSPSVCLFWTCCIPFASYFLISRNNKQPFSALFFPCISFSTLPVFCIISFSPVVSFPATKFPSLCSYLLLYPCSNFRGSRCIPLSISVALPFLWQVLLCHLGWG